jgi:hypothetical protein
MKKTLLLTMVIAGIGVANTRAQLGAGAMEQVDASQNRNQLNRTARAALTESNSVPELYDGEEGDVGPQSVVQPGERRKLFEAYADVQYFYTDNTLLTERRKIDTGVLASTVQAALAPTAYPFADGSLAPRLGYRHEWFDFGLDGKGVPGTGGNLKLRDLDFNAQTVFSDAIWTRGNWSFGGGFEWTRLMDTDDYHQFYQESVPNWMARWTLPVCDKSAFAVSYNGDYRFTRIAPQFLEFSTRDANDRTDHTLELTFTEVICRHAIFQPYYRMQYTHFTAYPEGPRNDYLNSVGAGLYFLICPNFSIRTFVNYDILASGNPRVNDYRKLDAGGGIDVSIRF